MPSFKSGLLRRTMGHLTVLIVEHNIRSVGNLTEYIASLTILSTTINCFTSHGGMIPDDKLYVKLGGEHGQGSMKFAIQLANLHVEKPIVFSIFEAKDTRNNLRTSLQIYQEQLEELKQTNQ